MSQARMLLWFAAPIDEVRPLLHEFGSGAAVLLAVESGTVVVPRDRMSVRAVVTWSVWVTRKSGGRAAVVAWDDQATLIFPIARQAHGWAWGDYEASARVMDRLGEYGPVRRALMSLYLAVSPSKGVPRKVVQGAGLFAEILGADEAKVMERLAQSEQRVAPEVLLDEFGKPDVAMVVRQIDAGGFDQWRTGRSSAIEASRIAAALFLAAVVVAVGLVVTSEVTWPFVGWEGVVILCAAFYTVLMAVLLRVRYRSRRMPIDEVLPVSGRPSV